MVYLYIIILNEMNAKTTKSDFSFTLISHGVYAVTYTSPVTGRSWRARVMDMELIDAVKNADEPKRKDLEMLKRAVKR